MRVCAQERRGAGMPSDTCTLASLPPQRLPCQLGAEQEWALLSCLLTDSLMGLWFCSC